MLPYPKSRGSDHFARRHQKLKSFFIDEKIPAEERGSIPLIACGRDIVWIYGGRTSAKFAPEAQTTQYVWIRITEAHHNERKN